MSVLVKNLSFSYGSHQVLHDISFNVDDGEFLSILGCNGVGKSTLFRCVLGLLDTYSGQVLINGVDTRKLPPSKMAKLVAYIPQNCSPTFNYSVEDVVLMGTTSGLNLLRSPGKKELERVEWALDKIGISHLRKRCFHHISGGERQLAVIARALVQEAKLLMLDEPTASLDFGNQILVQEQARALADEGYTIIQTTHNPEQSYMFSDKVLAIKDGRVLCHGEPQKIMTSDVISQLYGIDVDISSLYNDKVRICMPESFARFT
ncbi:MAG: ABC transporter ATP-binding protein [Oscillospiraceae bacterium]|nr:ABC transporter ATP-binding protein [Oscillospiraceae bacterium]